MLERMADFFEARLAGYDTHMLTNIADARVFYPATAARLPQWEGAEILDLGCGTGLELEFYFEKNPGAIVTGIDLSAGMLRALEKKFPGNYLKLICDSYFRVPMGCNLYDAAVSVESLHHFTQEAKTGLYRKLYEALKEMGYFLLTDYFALSEEEERHWFQELARIKTEEGITDEEFYHFDTPLTVEHEIQALTAAGFRRIEVLDAWGATHMLQAWR